MGLEASELVVAWEPHEEWWGCMFVAKYYNATQLVGSSELVRHAHKYE
jgi:hypothetical protein